MTVKENISLKEYNTFGIEASARRLAVFTNVTELREALELTKDSNKLVLGGGSNMLLTKDYDGTVLKNEIKGIEVVKEDDDHMYIRAGAGENWHGLVQYAVKYNFGGLENLSL